MTTQATKSPTREERGRQTNQEASQAAKQQFVAAALSMSWQLAIVVLVPVVGGFKLDQRFTTTPLLTITGFVLAMIGFALIAWRALQAFSPTERKHL